MSRPIGVSVVGPRYRPDRWAGYVDAALRELAPTFAAAGVRINHEQPYVAGEHFLHSVPKLVLLGEWNGRRVVVKASSDSRGRAEIARERAWRHLASGLLSRASVSQEVSYHEVAAWCYSVVEFVPQDCPFSERPLAEQYRLALEACDALESAATPAAAASAAASPFCELMSPAAYLQSVRRLTRRILSRRRAPPGVQDTVRCVARLLTDWFASAEYPVSLVHGDFVPQNFRVFQGSIVFIDLASFHLGHRYETLARFVNSMFVVNPPLAHLLTSYVSERGASAAAALHMLRMYKLLFLIDLFGHHAELTSGGLRELCIVREKLWSEIAYWVYVGSEPPNTVLEIYLSKREELRSAEEMRRRRALHE